ncbi:MAG: recombinase family protein, partial [Synergistaceae bacterium]|nr:recombinase family protein [Synergistaceae bacterium]
KFVLNMESFEVFEDAGYSAKNTERPAYQQMMARLRAGEFSHLVVWKIDRISRNLIDFATMYEEIKRLGVAFVSKNEQFDTSSAMGEAMLKIILVFAELERKVTSERVAAVMLSRASNGQWNGGRTPMGYSWDRETGIFSIVENEAAIIRLIYDMYDAEKSLLTVTRALNEKGLRSRRGVIWNPVTVQGILRNPFYVGTYRYNYRDEAKTGGNAGHEYKPETEWVMIEDHHDPIIKREQWERIAMILTKNRRTEYGGDTYNRKNVHVFAGLIKCGVCGSRMTAQPDRARSNGWRPSIYCCSHRRRFNNCLNKSVSDVTLGPFVLNYFSNLMKAQKNFGVSTSIEALEKKLLRGRMMADVEHIEGVGLQELFDMLRRGKFPEMPYKSGHNEAETYQAAEKAPQEMDLLVSEKRRLERAQARLQNLMLYGDEGISERDYLVERKRIADDISKIDARIDEIEKDMSSNITMTDMEFIEKASYFIMAHGLIEKREVNYEKIVREIDPRIIKDFLNSVVTNFCIKDGRVELIRFKNGMEHRFSYKGEET